MRRFSVLLLSAIVLLGTVLTGGGAFATAQDTDFADHPLVGPWDLDTDTENPENPRSWASFTADGTYLQVDVDGPVIGVWEPTGDATGVLTFSFVDEDGTTGTVRGSLEVAPDGQSVTATYTLEFVDPSGQSSGEIGPGTAEATRMEAEAPGTPVASFEEAFAAVEGTPEATPAS